LRVIDLRSLEQQQLASNEDAPTLSISDKFEYALLVKVGMGIY
jgi:hypothetical protein